MSCCELEDFYERTRDLLIQKHLYDELEFLDKDRKKSPRSWIRNTLFMCETKRRPRLKYLGGSYPWNAVLRIYCEAWDFILIVLQRETWFIPKESIYSNPVLGLSCDSRNREFVQQDVQRSIDLQFEMRTNADMKLLKRKEQKSEVMQELLSWYWSPEGPGFLEARESFYCEK